MRSRFQRDPAARHLAKRLADSARCGRHAAFQNYVTRLIQDAVTAASISQVQPKGKCGLFENLVSVFHHSAILSHKPVSFPLRLERVNRWEHIASRRRLAFSSHLGNASVLSEARV